MNYETNLKIQALPNPDTYFMYSNSISSFGVHSYYLRPGISFLILLPVRLSIPAWHHYHESILTLLIFLSKLWPNYSNCSTSSETCTAVSFEPISLCPLCSKKHMYIFLTMKKTTANFYSTLCAHNCKDLISHSPLYCTYLSFCWQIM